MQRNNLIEIIEHINEDVAKIQTSNVKLQEELKMHKDKIENTLDRACLQIIEILDFIYSIEKSMDLENLKLVVNKILRKLTLFLEELKVTEIILEDNALVDSKLTRVIDTKDVVAPKIQGEILEICRRGYMRAGKVIRPLDVITAK